MKKISFILLVLILVFSSVQVIFANNYDKDVGILEMKVQQLDKELKEYETGKKKKDEKEYRQKLYDWVILQGEYDTKSGKSVHISQLKYRDANGQIRSVVTDELISNNAQGNRFEINENAIIEDSDIVVVRYKDPKWWAHFSGDRLQHAVLSRNGWMIHAPGLGKHVENGSFNNLFYQGMPDEELVVEARIVKVNGITPAQRSSVGTHAQQFLGFEYPRWYEFPFDKHRTDKMYCTGLAWRAHRFAGQFRDLDADGGRMVMPSDLLRNPGTTVVTVNF